jgi:hypothetical protein
MRQCGNCSILGHYFTTCSNPGARTARSLTSTEYAEKAAAEARERSAVWKAAHPEAREQWLETRPGKADEYESRRARDWAAHYAAQPEHHRSRVKGYNLSKLYGINVAHYDVLFEFQGRVCACCGRHSTGTTRDWHTEHNHGSGQIRGITCSFCNVTLGRLGDTADAVGLACLELLEYLGRAGDFVSNEVADAIIGAMGRAKQIHESLSSD